MTPALRLLALAVLATLGAASFPATLEAQTSAPAPRPNVLLILGDDQAFDDFGFAGHPEIATPRLDALAAESALFRGYVTAPLCRPSLATLATGLYPHQHLVVGNDPSKPADRERLKTRLLETATLPRLLTDAGYRTLQTGKWWEGNYRDGGFTDGMTHGDPQRRGRHGDEGLTIGRQGIAPIEEFLDDVEEQPFFIWYAPFLPHSPHNAPPRLQERYAGKGRHPAEARYFANCTWFDESVGAVLDALDARGHGDDTIVLFCVDNGWVTLENGRGDFARSKRSPYERGIQTPVTVRWPGRVAPGARPQAVSTVDVVPTILAACGVDAPAPLPGHDLVALAADPRAARGPVFGGAWDHDQADAEDPSASLQVRFVVDGDDKLIQPKDPAAPTQLYDVVADHDEAHDRAAAEPERVAELRALLDAWWDPTPRRVARRPNLLFVVTDDQRWDQLSVEGHPVLRTPTMDGLAARGVRFTNSFVTTAICAASRATYLTGQWEGTHGYTFGTDPLAKDRPSLPRTLRAAGYRTGFIGKLGVKLEEPPRSLFDWFRPKDGVAYPKADAPPETPHVTDLIADESIGFLEQAAADAADADTQPFCLWISFKAPHAADGDPRQYIWPRALDGLYDDQPVPVHPLEAPEHFAALPAILRDSMSRDRWKWRFDQPDKRTAMIRGYWRMITGVDQALGRVLARLDELDLAANTVVVFTGDNGYFLGEYGLAGKWLIYERSIRVPLIVSDPRHPEQHGTTRDAPALNVDLAPTLLDLAGETPPAAMQGRSLVPLLEARAAAWRDDFFYEHRFDHERIPPSEGVRTARYSYARYYRSEPVVEQLFDRAEDPDQTRDLVGDPAYAEVLARLRDRTDRLRARRVR